eukprot:gene36093-44510_t
METYALKRVDAATTICEGLRGEIITRGIPASKLTVIPNAVNIEDFSVGGARDAALVAQLGLEGQAVLGFIGSFYAYEGLDVLLKALPAMLAAKPDIRVLLVGGGPQDAALKAQARELGIERQVIFAGRVPHGEVQRYYDLIDVLVYPRLKMRLTDLVTPLKPLEAMAQGKLVAASDVGGHRELIEDGQTGTLFAPDSPAAIADALAQLLDNRGIWAERRRIARIFVETHRNCDCCAAPADRAADRDDILAATGRTELDDMDDSSDNPGQAVSSALLRVLRPALPAVIGAAVLTFLFAAVMPMSWVAGIGWNLYLDRLSDYFVPPVGDAARLLLAFGMASIASMIAGLVALLIAQPDAAGLSSLRARFRRASDADVAEDDDRETDFSARRRRVD